MKIDTKRLLFRRQFVLGPDVANILDGWHYIEICDSVNAAIHPDLPSERVSFDGKTIVLLGNILDPNNPALSNQQILDTFASQVGCFDDLVKATYTYGGRWIFIYHDLNMTRMFHDACGLRQIYYMVKDGFVWCGSQPSILKYINNVDEDPDALEVTRLPEYAYSENAWFGEGTIYSGIKHLLPNHYLDFQDGSAHRYWPCSPIVSKSVDNEYLDSLARYLTGFLESAANRYDLMIPVTAGWDSRVLLAASRSISNKIYYYISTMNSLLPNHQDVAVPGRLLAKLGLPFNIIDPDPEDDPEYKRIYFTNVTQARDLPKSLTIHHFFKHCQDKVNISGNGAEIARSFYFKTNGRHKFTGSSGELAKLAGFPGVDYVVSTLGEWLAEAAPKCSAYGIDILDLFYWEQRIGNWGSMYQAEEDIAIEELWPFNVRALIEMMLSVDVSLRQPPDYLLFRMLIMHMWPQVLSEPINPTSPNRLELMLSKHMPPYVKSSYKRLCAWIRKSTN